MKKLILDTCQKTTFQAGGNFYEQRDGVSMGSSLGPVLANIIMTKLEKCVIQDLVKKNLVKFYGRYVDDTLLVIKATDIDYVHQKLNAFDPGLRFTVDKFENDVPHFLDLLICKDDVEIYRKPTNTGVYINYNSYTPWKFRVSWITSLVTRAKRICSNNALQKELSQIRLFASWNDFPKFISNKLIDKILKKPDKSNDKTTTDNKDAINIWFRVPYLGNKGDHLLKSLIRKIRRNCKKEVNISFNILHDTKKVQFYTNEKDKTPFLNNSYIVYEITCPACNSKYIGKTERTLQERTYEHAWKDKTSTIYNHLDECEQLRYINNLMSIDCTDIDRKASLINLVRSNIKILDRHSNWNILLFKEALAIKQCSPNLNHGLKASKEPQLF